VYQLTAFGAGRAGVWSCLLGRVGSVSGQVSASVGATMTSRWCDGTIDKHPLTSRPGSMGRRRGS
jgi:hypothetical protein